MTEIRCKKCNKLLGHIADNTAKTEPDAGRIEHIVSLIEMQKETEIDEIEGRDVNATEERVQPQKHI
jgi:hypothetical protein